VRRYAANWSKATREASAAAYVPLSFDAGEAYQFDWSHEIIILDGATVTVKVAHDNRAPGPAHTSLRNRRNRQRKLALQKPGVTSNCALVGPPPLRYMKTTQRRACSPQRGGKIGCR
jgi:hypothetical protein